MRILKPFAAGLLAVLTFHQGALAALHALGVTDRTAYVLTPTVPLGVPQVLSAAFWGGVWAVVLWPVATRLAARTGSWIAGIGLLAVAPSLIAWFLVAPLKGQPMTNVLQATAMTTSLLVNGAWGVGLVLLMKRAMGIAPAARTVPYRPSSARFTSR
jgi:hypothetical protein